MYSARYTDDAFAFLKVESCEIDRMMDASDGESGRRVTQCFLDR